MLGGPRKMWKGMSRKTRPLKSSCEQPTTLGQEAGSAASHLSFAYPPDSSSSISFLPPTDTTTRVQITTVGN